MVLLLSLLLRNTFVCVVEVLLELVLLIVMLLFMVMLMSVLPKVFSVVLSWVLSGLSVVLDVDSVLLLLLLGVVVVVGAEVVVKFVSLGCLGLCCTVVLQAVTSLRSPINFWYVVLFLEGRLLLLPEGATESVGLGMLLCCRVEESGNMSCVVEEAGAVVSGSSSSQV